MSSGWRSAWGSPRGAERLGEALSGASVEVVGLRAQVYRVKEFNDAVARTENKATVLFEACVGLIEGVLGETEDPEVVIDVDRHGGR